MSFKYVLGKYIKDPEKYPESVLFYDSKVVIIQDAFPKSIFHFLVLPRASHKTKQSPLLAFKDINFKNEILHYIDLAKDMLVDKYNLKYESTVKIEDFLLIGCHSVPSLSNLHIHVITKDFHSPCLKNKKHFNSFNTQFFIPIEELPLLNKTKSEEMRYDEQKMEKLCKTEDLKCPYCGENFGNKFAALKVHLTEEFAKNFTVK